VTPPSVPSGSLRTKQSIGNESLIGLTNCQSLMVVFFAFEYIIDLMSGVVFPNCAGVLMSGRVTVPMMA